MSQTVNYGFHLWGDTPPSGATGKDLRDAVIGEGPDSLANMVDTKLKKIADAKEDVSNKVQSYTGMDGSWSNSAVEYPSVVAVRDFVQSYVSTFSVTAGQFKQIFNGVIKPATDTVQLNTVTWNGDTAGRANLLEMFYKISDSAELPDTFLIELSSLDSTGTVTTMEGVAALGVADIYLNDKITALRETFGIVAYAFKTSDAPATVCVIAADRAGTLPSTIVEQMIGANPGANVQYEAGVYVLRSSSEYDTMFVSKAVSCMSVKNYIDKKFMELAASGAG